MCNMQKKGKKKQQQHKDDLKKMQSHKRKEG